MSIKLVLILCCVWLIVACTEKNKKERASDLSVLYMAQAGYQPEHFKLVTDTFEQISGIRVKLKFVKYDEVYGEILKNSETHSAIYDVFPVDNIWVADFVSNGVVADLSGQKKRLLSEISLPGVVESFEYSGQLSSIPFMSNFQLLFYNRELLRKAGFTAPPATLEELYQQMSLMKKKKIITYPWIDSWANKEALLCDFVWLTAAYGGDLSGRQPLDQALVSPPAVKALTFMKRLIDDGLANPLSLQADEVMVKDFFVNGQAAFTTNWIFQYQYMINPANVRIAGQGGVASIPVSVELSENQPTVTVSGFQGLGIAANSRHKETAQNFINFMTSALVERAFIQEMPMKDSVVTDPYLNMLDTTLQLKKEELTYASHRPRVANYTEISAIVRRYLFIALNDEVSPDTALQNAAAELKNLKD